MWEVRVRANGFGYQIDVRHWLFGARVPLWWSTWRHGADQNLAVGEAQDLFDKLNTPERVVARIKS